MDRPRAFAAIIKDNLILMTKHIYPDKTFWTLPGGGLRKEKVLRTRLFAR
ncbi:hypothetical protein AABM38_09860 [Heyndrickxia sp. MSNUG]